MRPLTAIAMAPTGVIAMNDLAVVDLKGLRSDYGITTSRTHLIRLMNVGKFPEWFSSQDDPKSRRLWYRREIEKYLRDRGGTR